MSAQKSCPPLFSGGHAGGRPLRAGLIFTVGVEWMDLQEKVLKSDYIYRGKIISLRRDTVELPNGRQSSREIVEHSGGVCIAPLTDEGDLLFVRQFRAPYRRVLLELPAGKITPGEEPLACGKRELLEETGATAREYQPLGKMFPSVGYTDEIIYMYAARGLTFGRQQPDEDEFLSLERIPLDEAVRMVLRDEIEDAKTQIAILKLRMLSLKG